MVELLTFNLAAGLPILLVSVELLSFKPAERLTVELLSSKRAARLPYVSGADDDGGVDIGGVGLGCLHSLHSWPQSRVSSRENSRTTRGLQSRRSSRARLGCIEGVRLIDFNKAAWNTKGCCEEILFKNISTLKS